MIEITRLWGFRSSPDLGNITQNRQVLDSQYLAKSSTNTGFCDVLVLSYVLKPCVNLDYDASASLQNATETNFTSHLPPQKSCSEETSSIAVSPPGCIDNRSRTYESSHIVEVGSLHRITAHEYHPKS